jgi:hypothetical protein
MVGVGAAPLNNNVEALEAAVLQPVPADPHRLDRALPGRWPRPRQGRLRRALRLDDLLLMDTATKVKTLVEGPEGHLQARRGPPQAQPGQGRRAAMRSTRSSRTIPSRPSPSATPSDDPFASSAPPPKPDAAPAPDPAQADDATASNDNQMAAALLNLTAKFMREAA